MLAAVLAFIVVTGSILGAYAAGIHMIRRRAARSLEFRLREVTDPEGVPDAGVALAPTDGALPAVDRLVSGTRAGSFLERLIEQAGVRTTPGSIMVWSAGTGIILALAAHTMLRHPAVAAAGFILGTPMPTLWLVQRRSSRLKKFEEQFPDALDLVSRAIRAGHAFQSAMGMVSDELPAPVGAEFRRAFEQQNFGLPLRDALTQMTERVPILDVKFFATAVTIQRESGGNLAEILDGLSHVVRERFKILRQVRVHTAHGRITGYVLLALPAFLAVALSIINSVHMKPLFEEPIGHMLLMGVVVAQIVGFIWIRRVIKIEV